MKKLFLFLVVLIGFITNSNGSVNLSISGGTVPINMDQGGTYSISVTVQNSGSTSTSTSFYINISINSSSTYGGQTYLTDILVSGGISAFSSRTLSTNITIPCTYGTGTKYILAGADATGLISESNETDNNFGFSILLHSGSSTTPSASASPSAMYSGSTSTLSVTAGTLGTGANWYWYSGSCSGTSIGSGSSITVSPSSTTNYYVKAVGTCNTTSCASTTLTILSCSPSTPSSCSASIGSPPNGLHHWTTVSCSSVSGVDGYYFEYSLDNSNWYYLNSGTSTSWNVDFGDYPNLPIYYRVRTYCGSTFGSPRNAATFPIYTACDYPAAPTVVPGSSSSSINITINSESPVANPNYTTYAIYCYTSSSSYFVQASGALGSSATGIYRTLSDWGTGFTVTGLASNTNYCFLIMAKNGNGDVQSSSSSVYCYTTCPTIGVSYSSSGVTCNGGNNGSITSISGSGGATPYTYSKDAGRTWQTANSFSGLSSGNDTIKVKDNNGCISSGYIVNISQPSAMTFSTSVTPASCCTCNTGSISVTPSGGVGSYQYSINGGSYQASNTFSSLAQGSYAIRVRDGNGCVVVSTVVVTAPTATISIDYSSSVIPGWQREGESFTGSIAANFSAGLSFWRVEVYKNGATSPVHIYYNSSSNVINFSSSDFGTLAQGDVISYYAVLDVSCDVHMATTLTSIIEKKWDRKHVIYHNTYNQPLKLPLKYDANTTGIHISFNRDISTEVYFPYNLEFLAFRDGIRRDYFYNTTIIRYVNDSFCVLDYFHGGLDTLFPGVIDYTITYDGSGLTETGKFDFTKVGELDPSTSNDKIVIFVAGIANTIEADFTALKSDIHGTASEGSSNSFSLASYLNENGYDCWYVAQPNSNEIKINSYDVGVALAKILALKPHATEINFVCHSKGGLEVRALLDSLSQSLDGKTFNFRNFQTLNSHIVKKVMFLDVPQRGASLSEFQHFLIDLSKNFLDVNRLLNLPGVGDLLIPIRIVNKINSKELPANIIYGNLTGYNKSDDLDDKAVNLTESTLGFTPQYLHDIRNLFGDAGNILQMYQVNSLNTAVLHTSIHQNNVLNDPGVTLYSHLDCNQTETNLHKILRFFNESDPVSTIGSCNTSYIDIANGNCIASVLSGASVFYKSYLDTSYNLLSKTDETGAINFEMFGGMQIGDSVMIKATGKETVVFPIDSTIINTHSFNIVLLHTLLASNGVQYPAMNLVTQGPVTFTDNIDIKVSARNATHFEINSPFNQDTAFTSLTLGADSIFTAHLDTGNNNIKIRCIGTIDTQIVEKNVYYSTDSQNTYNLFISCDSSSLGTQLYIVGKGFVKQINSLTDTVPVLTGFNTLRFRKLGYIDSFLTVDSVTSINLTLQLAPRSYSSPSDSSIMDFVAHGANQFWKTITMRDTATMSIVSLKQYDDSLSGTGLTPTSRKYELTHLNTLWSKITFSTVLDQISHIGTANMYMMEIVNDTGFIKFPFDTLLSGASLDSLPQKVIFYPVTFDSGRVPKVGYVIVQKLPPIVSSYDTIILSENDSTALSVLSRITDPDSVHNDMSYALIDSLPTGLTVSMRADSVFVRTNHGFSGNTSFRINVTHDWLTITDTIKVRVIPDVVISSSSGSTSFCTGTTAMFEASIHGVSTPVYQWQRNGVNVGIDTSVYFSDSLSAGDTITCLLVNRTDSTEIAVSNPLVINLLPLPIAGIITGDSTACPEGGIALADTVAGGLWSSGTSAIATIDTSTGVFSAIAAGIETISYSVTNVCGTAIATKVITINPLPHTDTITGPIAVCEAATINLTDTVTGGSWSCSDVSILTVGSTGIVTGIGAGSATITYMVINSCGTDFTTHAVSVNPLPDAGALSGATSVCVLAATTLSSTVVGGDWGSSDTSIAEVSSSGNVTGVSAGSATISYSVTNGCGTAIVTDTLTVSPLPDAGSISGATSVCEYSTITMSSTATGGTWTSGDTSIASVNVAGGVTGISVGSATISYTVTNSCGIAVAIDTLTVNPSPHAGTISGAGTVCEGSTITLYSTVSGGYWTNFDPTGAEVTDFIFANVDSATGVVSGVASGRDNTIWYVYSNGCGFDYATTSVYVTPLLHAGSITGSSSICPGSTNTLSDTTAGGVWSTSDASIASVDASGTVHGIASGSATISYTTTGSCNSDTATYSVSVLSLSDAGTITGVASLCEGSSTGFTSGSSGGSWSSSNASVASVDVSGTVSGIASGSATISYITTGSCNSDTATYSVSVLPLSDAGTISGVASLCEGSSTGFTSSGSSGTWSTSNASVASVDVSGTVSGVGSGSATISYITTGLCNSDTATYSVSVLPLTHAGTITGVASVCAGSSSGFSSSGSSGTWSTSNPSVASVDASGIVYGIASGSATISYITTGSCNSDTATYAMSVLPLSDAGTITGVASLCEGSSTGFTSGSSGGTWSTSNPSVASVDASGIVYGIASGSATISYITTGLCNSDTATHSVSVLPLTHAGTITGVASVCDGSSTGFTTSGTGGTWSSSDASIASVDVSGTVSGLASGSATISYITTGSCNSDTATYSVSVLPLSDAGSITGIASLCEGSSTGFTTSGSGGTWSSSNASVASVDVSGTVYGIASGSATISYITTGSCNSDTATYSVSVLPLSHAGSITGIASLCEGSSTGFTTSGTGGSWSTSNASVASVNVSGTVSGVGSGSATISYIATGSCNSDTATYAVTILPLPFAGTLSSAGTVCPGASTLVSATVTGGVWTSSDVSRATISSSGLITGVSAGAVTISYAITNSCGTSITTTNITVNPAPAAGTLSGVTTVCSGATTTLGSSVTGGSWSSSNTSVATISSGAIVTGVAPGTDTIIYTVTNSCGSASAMRTITVNPLPAVGTITGSSLVCVAANTTLSNTVSGGTWSSGTTSVATVNSSGLVRGVAAGIVTISYSVANSCGTATATKLLNVGAFAGTVTGASNICTGSTTTYSASGAAGGTWSSTATSVATITSGGIATGVSGGSSSIRYTVTNSCGTAVASATLVVSVAGAIASIVGSSAACPGVTLTMTNSTTGGTWSSTNTSLATVSATGVVTTLSPGTDTIVYTVTNACGTVSAIKPITITGPTYPAAIAGSTAAICVGATMTYTDGTTGGVWSISNPLIATVNSSGVVTGVAAGTDTVLYTITNSCGLTGSALRTITINAPAAAGTITGPSNICTGSTVTYTATGTTGGAWSSSNTSAATVSSTGVVTPVSASATTLRYTVTSACGTDVASLYVTVAAPGAPAAISGPLNLCVGSSATFTDATAGGSWSSSASSIATINSSGVATGVANGTATITYTITNACGTYFAVRNLAVNATVPVVTISGPSTVAIGGSPITLTHTGPTGVWSSVSPSLATISTGGVVTGVAAGADTIKYTATNGCGAGVATKVITITEHREAGGTTGHAEPLISLYPNPTTGVVMIKLQGTIGDAAISVTDISGKTVLTTMSHENRIEINLSNVARGVYLVTVKTENSAYTGKVIVQ